MIRFVPQNIGLNAITREQYIERHVTDFANTLYNRDEARQVIAYIDGTYCYIEKSSNFQALRQSYCLHKGRHLVKPALIVAPDGYILDIHGPYFSDGRNNDAAMLQYEFENDANALREWMGEGAIVIVDRGYRDALPLLQNLGIQTHMPRLLEQGETQLSTEDANDTRLITKTRWIVEARNGHLKSIFKIFKDIIPYHHVMHLRQLYLICGAIINRYKDPILMEGATAELAENMLERARVDNPLRDRAIIQARLQTIWRRLHHHELLDFPILDLNYLRELTIGIYQIKLAPSYIQDTIMRDENEIVEISEHREEPGLVRFRLFSRFRNQTRYQQWIQYVPVRNLLEPAVDEPILAYYLHVRLELGHLELVPI